MSSHPLHGQSILRMNGIGNEILVLDLRGSAYELSAADARAIARAPRLAFDQLMVLHDPRRAGAMTFMRIYNTDGSRSATCGNGARCVAWALSQDGAPRDITLETDAGLVWARREADTVYTINMGRPRLDWREIPLSHDVGATGDIALDPPVAGAPARFSAAGMGNPHAVFFVPDARAVDLEALGPVLEHHPLFPQRANISFAQIVSPREILLRVWERGTGATKACGSAACATLVCAARAGLAERRARVKLPGGDLTIAWRADDFVDMTGPVEFEFETQLDGAIFESAPA